MKIFLRLLLVISFIFVAEAHAQVGTDSATAKDTINISRMVESQILAAREKEEHPKEISVKLEPQNHTESIKESSPDYFSFIDELPWNVSVLSVVSMFILGYTLIKRKTSSKRLSKNSLVKNISAIRTETPIIVKNSKLRTLRRKLAEKDVLLNMNNNTLSLTARELKISKGELILAAKIKSSQLKKSSMILNGNAK